MSVTGLYNDDFALWTAETARLLRAGRFDEVDVEHVAEEIEDMGKRDKRELHGRLTVLILGLSKRKWQAEKPTEGWQSTLLTHRVELDRLLEDSPSLRRTIAGAIVKVYPDVRQLAESETGLPGTAFPNECPFTPNQILDRAFLPQ